MVDELIRLSHNPQSGFYLNEFESLSGHLSELESAGQKTLLIGVSFASIGFCQPIPDEFKTYCYHGNGRNEGKAQGNDPG